MSKSYNKKVTRASLFGN